MLATSKMKAFSILTTLEKCKYLDYSKIELFFLLSFINEIN